MKRTSVLFCTILSLAGLFFSQFALADLKQQASETGKPVLIYYHGSDWCVSGETALKVWNDSEFQNSLAGKFILGTIDSPSVETEEIKAQNAAADSLKIGISQYPAMAYYTPQGECCAVWGNIPFDVTVKSWTEKIGQMTQLWLQAQPQKEKALALSGEEAANAAAEFFNTLAPLSSVGMLRSDKSFKSVWQVLEKQDPEDKTGWRRFYNFDYQWYGNKVSDFRNKNQFEEGAAFIQSEQNDPRNSKLTVEQKQVLALLPFVLNRNKPECKAENIELLKKVVLMDSTTRWGIGAAGWLKEWGEESPAPIKTLSERMAEIFTPLKEREAGTENAFEYNLPLTVTRDFSRQTPEEILAADLAEIKDALNPAAVLTDAQKQALLRYRALSLIGTAAVAETISFNGGAQIANMFFNSTDWLEAFLESGPIPNAAKAWKTLDAMLYQSACWKTGIDAKNQSVPWVLSLPGRNIAMALALNAQKDETESVQALESFYRLSENQRLQKDAYNYTAREWRFIVLNQPYDNLWINEYRNNKPDDYSGACWACRYISYNFFGDTVQGRLYGAPWSGVYTGSETANKIGGVCGALSYFGSTTAKSHGVLSVPGGQPGHCAYMFRAADGRWRLAYNIEPFTGAHYNFWGLQFAGLDMIEAIYKNSDNSKGELLYIQAEILKTLSAQPENVFDPQVNALYKAALAVCPAHYGIHLAYANWLQQVKAPYDVWSVWADSVIVGLNEYQDSAWGLINRYYLPQCAQNGGKEETLKRLLTFHKQMRQPEAPTAEMYNFRGVLENHYNALGKDNQAAMELFKTALNAQFNTSNLFGVTLTWGADKFMADPGLCEQMGLAVSDVFAQNIKQGEEYGGIAHALKGMLLKASRSDNLPMYTQICQLIKKIAPRQEDNPYPTEDFSGKLLSDKAMLKISTSGGYDSPDLYPYTLDTARNVDRTFHTNSETAPWAQLTLAGESEITGILVRANTGYYRERNVPIKVWVSENGTDWTEVFTSDKLEGEWRIDLSAAPVKAKFVKVGRTPEVKNDCFHLGKILVYGKPLY